MSTSSVTSLIDSVISAHGGLSRFNNLTSITARLHATGMVLGKQRFQHLATTAKIFTRSHKVIFQGLGSGPDEEWIYTPTRVWKQSVSSGKVLEARDNPRSAFANHTIESPWDDFHTLYFSGYALWQYTNFPYFLTRSDIIAEEVAPHSEYGQTWRVLSVKFPPQEIFGSHSTEQKYYFDSDFHLRRHDYAPDVLAGSPAAHYSFDEIEVAGFIFPTLRRVVAKGQEDGVETPLLFGPTPTLILLLFLSFQLHSDNGEEGIWALKGMPIVNQ